MKKMIIAALVGGLILFVWQFLSFAALNIHASQMQITDKQDELLEALAASGLAEGEYVIPNANSAASEADQKAFMDKYVGQPWAQISYHKSLDMTMGMNMARAFLVNVIAALLLAWLLMQFADLSMKSAVLSSLAIGLIGYFTINYLNAIWFKTDSLPDLLDAVVQWGLVGAWMGWYLRRN